MLTLTQAPGMQRERVSVLTGSVHLARPPSGAAPPQMPVDTTAAAPRAGGRLLQSGVWVALGVLLVWALTTQTPLVQRLRAGAAHPSVSPEAATERASGRGANAFGTPIPREAPVAGSLPVAADSEPLAAATPAPGPVRAALGAHVTNALPDYVGTLAGRFVDGTFYSQALDREMPYFIYLPPGYSDEPNGFPVLYLLHGGSGTAEEWAGLGFVDALDAAILRGAVPPTIVVLPQGDFGYWVDHVAGGPQWGTYLTSDLVAHVDGKYRTLAVRERRAIGGLSAGATGALVQGFNQPDLFGVVGAHSPALRENSREANFLGQSMAFLGEGAEFAARDPISLARKTAKTDAPILLVDIGKGDPWLPRADVLRTTLRQRGIAHQWHLLDGGHDIEYWSENIPLYLQFYGEALAR